MAEINDGADGAVRLSLFQGGTEAIIRAGGLVEATGARPVFDGFPIKEDEDSGRREVFHEFT